MKGLNVRVLVSALALCGVWPGSVWAEVHEVTVRNFRFDPNDLSIQPGDTVRWSNVEGFHDVTEDNFAWASETGIGWVFERTFESTGEIFYHCTVHSGPGQPIQTSMNGRITVKSPVEIPSFADGFELASRSSFHLHEELIYESHLCSDSSDGVCLPTAGQ